MHPLRIMMAIAGSAAALAACASLKEAGPPDAAPAAAAPSPASDRDAGDSGADARAPDRDAENNDASKDADATDPTGLDPGLVLPNLGQPACDYPGGPAVCDGLHVCRIATPDSGRCDDCTAAGRCGTGVGQACSQSLDCDTLFQCFRGKCTLFCTLPAGTECGGGPGRCVNVGHLQKGLCDPAFL